MLRPIGIQLQLGLLLLLKRKYLCKISEKFLVCNTFEKEIDNEGSTKFRPHGIVVPKCEDIGDIEEIAKLLAEFENRHFVNPLIVNSAKDSMFQKQMLHPKPRSNSTSESNSVASVSTSTDSNAIVSTSTSSPNKSESKETSNVNENIVIPKFSILCGIETVKGVLNLSKLLEADERIEGVLFGGEDFRASIGSTYSLQFHSYKHTRHLPSNPELV